MNVAEVETPDHMTCSAGTLAAMAREQDRWREAMEAMARPSSLRALQDALEQTRLDTSTLRMAEQAHEFASDTGRLVEQMQPSLAEQCRWIGETVGDLGALARLKLDTPALRVAEQAHELASVTDKITEQGQPSLAEQCRRIGEAVGDMERIAQLDSFAHLRGSVENWPELGTQDFGFEIAKSQPNVDFGINPLPPRTGGFGIDSLALDPGDPGDPVIPVENREAYACLFTLENKLRRFVADQLAAVFGPSWEKQRVPGETRQKWCDNQNKASAAGQTPESLIAYGYLDDYCGIIVRNDNWDAVFATFFGQKDSVKDSFRRLHPLRHKVAHMRPLTREEMMVVCVETRRLLKSIGENPVL